MESTKYRYQYPNNLAEKPMIWLWTLQELTGLAVLSLVLITIGIRKHGIGLSLCLTAGTGLLLAHFGGSDRSVLDHLKTMLLYLKNPKVWEYMPVRREKSGKQERKGETGKKKNRAWIFVSVLLGTVSAWLLWKGTGMSTERIMQWLERLMSEIRSILPDMAKGT